MPNTNQNRPAVRQLAPRQAELDEREEVFRALDALPYTWRLLVQRVLGCLEAGEEVNLERIGREIGVPTRKIHSEYTLALREIGRRLETPSTIEDWMSLVQQD